MICYLLFRSLGMSIRVFDHNFEEAKGIMERASRWAISSQYEQSRANKVAQFFYESGMDAEDIDEYIHDFEQQLNSKGIVKEETTYRTEENAFQEDEKHLFDEIKRLFQKNNHRKRRYKTQTRRKRHCYNEYLRLPSRRKQYRILIIVLLRST